MMSENPFIRDRIWTQERIGEYRQKCNREWLVDTRRVKLSLSSTAGYLVALIAGLLVAHGVETADVDEGWTLYKGNLENRVDVTFHEGSIAGALTFWLAVRTETPEVVDCGRIYTDEDDWCCKDLHNFQSRAHGLDETFPGFSFKLKR